MEKFGFLGYGEKINTNLLSEVLDKDMDGKFTFDDFVSLIPQKQDEQIEHEEIIY